MQIFYYLPMNDCYDPRPRQMSAHAEMENALIRRQMAEDSLLDSHVPTTILQGMEHIWEK